MLFELAHERQMTYMFSVDHGGALELLDCLVFCGWSMAVWCSGILWMEQLILDGQFHDG